MKDVCIIGSGISGVALAYCLSKYQELNVTVIDNRKEAGGCIKSIFSSGYMAESGPNGILNSKIHAKALFNEAHIDDVLEYSSSYTSKRYIQMNKILYAAPSNPLAALKTPLLSFRGKMRILAEPFIRPLDDDIDETVSSFFTRRIGKEASDNLIATVLHGINAGNAEKISVRSAFPNFYGLEKKYGSLFRGMKRGLSSSTRGDRAEKTKLISSNRGMQGIVCALFSKCRNVKFIFNKTVNKVSHNHKYVVQASDNYKEVFDYVIFCCNAYDTSSMISEISKDFSDKLKEVTFSPVAICAVGYERGAISHPLDGFGYLVMPKDKSNILGTLFSSTLYKNRAPDKKALLTCITGGDENRDFYNLNDKDIVNNVCSELSGVLGIKKSMDFSVVYKTDRALPQYMLNHYKIVDAMENLCSEHKGLFFGGNSYKGVSVSDCIKLSIDISDKIGSSL